ncbi:hypothetical protein [Naasia aerilata]|uniref:Uncharacterized protein n=1 Tax=Naasia aerilata TaxID=1162966 RepID=A0ABN6XQ47_9MICO|nr:hypothetical protein [Naasia aerilata]BDZ45563.1 hypothetical protein GCM10025866_14720 [Naasia aerilata]
MTNVDDRPGGPGRGGYPAEKSEPRETIEELKARIPGWGADLDPADRPAFPREQSLESGAHWDIPDLQPELVPRERSIEHKFLPPVFGTAQPLKGLSGMIRAYAYDRFSEGRVAHWMLLVLGDRVDVVESRFTALAQLKPDNIITETGILAEFKRDGIGSRFGRNRTDTKHMWLDPVIVAGPTVLLGWVAFRVIRRLAKG